MRFALNVERLIILEDYIAYILRPQKYTKKNFISTQCFNLNKYLTYADMCKK